MLSTSSPGPPRVPPVGTPGPAVQGDDELQLVDATAGADYEKKMVFFCVVWGHPVPPCTTLYHPGWYRERPFDPGRPEKGIDQGRVTLAGESHLVRLL